MSMTLWTYSRADCAIRVPLGNEIQSGVALVMNPKSAEALRDARVNIMALLDPMRRDRGGARHAKTGEGTKSSP